MDEPPTSGFRLQSEGSFRKVSWPARMRQSLWVKLAIVDARTPKQWQSVVRRVPREGQSLERSQKIFILHFKGTLSAAITRRAP